MRTIHHYIKNKTGFVLFAAVLFWLKTYLSYQLEFNLGVQGTLQELILFINPLSIPLLLFSFTLFIKGEKKSKLTLLFIYLLLTLLLYSNIMYYREFTDFLTVGTIVGSGNVSGGLFASSLALFKPQDLLYWGDFLFLAVYAFKTKRSDSTEKATKLKPILVLTSAILLFVGNLTLAEIDRPQLLTRTFDRNYIVKYLGINFYAGYDSYKTLQNNQIKASADESDMSTVLNYVQEHHAQPDPDMFGSIAGKNLIYIELESIQQFLIDYQLEDENGELQEVMPFVNQLFNDEATHSFNNFFHQTGQGKTSDAEMLAENSLYGLAQGGAFSQVGSENTFQSASKILEAEQDYTSAVFHGNVGSFWNRNDTYQSMGVDYFFDSGFYNMDEGRTMEYGLKDKLFFQESVQYLEQLPQPFYTKFLTVTHHFPFPLDEANATFPKADTNDETINNFFVTAHYMDEAIEEFFNYLKESGLYEDSVFVLYGDHYGISDMRNPSLAPLLDKYSMNWDAYDNAMMQRVPFMIHIPGETNGQIHEEFASQTDILPTVLHLLGIETQDYTFMGTDVFSPEHDPIVPLRNGNIITPKYTIIGQTIYNTETGELLRNLSGEELKEIDDIKTHASAELAASDSILMKDLLRFYTPEVLKTAEETEYSYINQLSHLRNELNQSTTLIEQNNGQTTAPLYETNAPENNNEELDQPVDLENQMIEKIQP
ncbi:LTA synthase family protein [Lacticigenium naphthae]|uniref:LTA synthase family protein n=1 Tax=Lacticigenium naphthae TaxID=515351 RepID=UPI000405E023|nr:LTA synthase family protein [Lacticigenium naphthae]